MRAERRDGYVCLAELAKRHALVAERIEQLDMRLAGGRADEVQDLRGELMQLEREMRLIAGAS
jgi:hypothetical protein